MKITSYLFVGLLSLWYCSISQAITIDVPGIAPTIAAAVDMAVDGDEIVVQPGLYAEQGIEIAKDIVICSEESSKSPHRVIIQGMRETVFTVTGKAQLIGLEMTNSRKPVVVHGECIISRCVFYDNHSDVISFEAEGSGTVEYCIIRDTSDDGIDVDSERGDITIRRNKILQCDDDGIEIRLKPTREVMNYSIKENVIIGCGEDGIQLIDYNDVSPRAFVISGNHISDNAMAGIGCMADGNTRENYRGSPMAESVRVYSNVIAGNTVGVTTAPGLRLSHNYYFDNEEDVKGFDGMVIFDQGD